MTKLKISMKAQRIWALVLHIVCACVALLGLGMMYANPNFGRGINHIGEVAYEDTEDFDQKVEECLDDIFTFIKYSDIFGEDGNVEINQVVLRMTFGPDATEEYTLNDVIEYLKGRGYTIDNNFVCTRIGGLPSLVTGPATDDQGYLEWSIVYPDLEMSFRDKNIMRTDREEAALAIMRLLHSYSVAHGQLFSEFSNMHFKIEYADQNGKKNTVYTNDQSLTAESIHSYGKYAAVSGTSVFYDANFSGIGLNTLSSLASCNPYGGNKYYLLVAVDTTYPYQDGFFVGRENYIRQQYYYILGGTLLVVGGMMTLFTLIYMVMMTGKSGRRQEKIRLYAFDRLSTETGVLLGIAMIFACYKIFPIFSNRIIHPLVQSDLWYLVEKMVKILIVYFGVLFLMLSMVRRYSAGVIKQKSLIYRAATAFRRQVASGTPMFRTFIGYLGHVIVNAVVVTAAWLTWDSDFLRPTYKMGLLAVILTFFAASNIWGFYMRYRRAVMRNSLKEAIAHLKEGDTGFRIDTEDFDGPEYELAVNINNVGAGLETALNEKVRSERLKADLITNVSHDIKTPLTSIINYVDLMKREKPENPAIAHYLEVLEQKSQRLKILIEDLVEASKASSGNIKLEMTTLELGEMIEQTNGEFEEKFAERGLTIVMGRADRALPIYADGRRLWRVLENLYNNTFKYALQNSRVYVNCEVVTESEGEFARFTIKNISEKPLNISPTELTERFVRGDVSRTTEGSGLGLSIAKSLTELMGGSFEIVIDGDLFKGVVTFPIVNV